MKARYALLCALTVLGICAVVNSAPAQGTAFTYQGCLNDGGGPANGSYDLQFTLYNGATNRGSTGTPITLPATVVTNGLFAVTLDFGAGVFAGQPLWLEIGVRTNGGQSSFLTLSPRQPFTSAPYAVTAANLSGTLPVSQLAGPLPTTQLSGTLPVESIVGAQPANLNLATNLIYTYYNGGGQALLPVCIGHTYVYYPTKVYGIFDGSYELQIVGTNYDDTNAYFVDPGAVGYFGVFQTNQVFVATQGTVTFLDGNFFEGGPVTDTLFDLANLTINGTVNGIGQFSGVLNGTGQFTGTVNGTGQFNGNLLGLFSGVITNSAITNSSFSGLITNSTFSGAVTNSTLAGDAQGGAVTNLDYSINNLTDNGGSLLNILARSPNGAVVYVPNGIFPQSSPVAILTDFGGIGLPSDANPLLIYGNGSRFSALASALGNSNLLDQFAAPFGLPAIDLRGISLIDENFRGGLNDIGYASAPGASGNCNWNDVALNQFLIGACTTSSDGAYRNMQLLNNNVGFILAPYADVSTLDVRRAFGNTNAAVESDSHANLIIGDFSGSENIGVLIGGGGNDELHIAAENTTNCTIAIGYPNNWPFTVTNADPADTQYAGTQMGNYVSINPIRAGFGYGLASSVNWVDQFAYDNSAFMKVWNDGFFGGAELECESLYNEVGVISYTHAGDIAPYSFDFFTTGGLTNLFVFSDGSTIPSEDGCKVGVNLPELQFTKNVLEYSRDTNGNLYAAGNITAAGVLTASAIQVGALTMTNAVAGSLLGTGSESSVTGITIGNGLTLSGGTLSLSPGIVITPPAGTSINTYTADHLATAQDNTILVNGHRLTITLPDAAALGAGRSYTIKLITGSTATVATTGAQTIDGAASYALSSQYKYVMVQSDGTQWWVLANN